MCPAGIYSASKGRRIAFRVFFTSHPTHNIAMQSEIGEMAYSKQEKKSLNKADFYYAPVMRTKSTPVSLRGVRNLKSRNVLV